MIEIVKKAVLRFGNFSDSELLEIANRVTVIPVRKNERVIKEGQICREFYFINKGSFRHFIVMNDGTEAVINLFIDNDWMFESKSFMSQSPSETIIEATEDAELLRLSTWDFHELVKISDSFFLIGRIFEQAIQNQDFQNNRITPEEKYSLLLATKPQIIQKFPLKQIASYLGMTPETLSRIRRKLIS